jgi:hypothetical protein
VSSWLLQETVVTVAILTTMRYKDAAVALWGEAGAFAHDCYARNRGLYPELPDELPIVIGIAAYGHCVGLTRAVWPGGPRISLASQRFAEGRNLVEDTMIHEMLHAWLHITGQDIGHDSAGWYTAVNRLSAAVLGRELNAVRGAQRKSVRVPNPRWRPIGTEPRTVVRKVRVQVEVPHRDVAGWPYALRPADWSPGEPIDCPTY